MALTRQELEDNIVHAAKELVGRWGTDTAYDIGPALTCGEADALATLLRSVAALSVHVPECSNSLADCLIEGHAESDDSGDDHYTGNES